MGRSFFLAVLSLGAIVGLGGLGALGWFVLAPDATAFAGGRPISLAEYHGPSPTGVPPAMAAQSLIKRGQYLAQAADCEACHTVKGGKPFAGGLAFKLPFGDLFTPNITPDPKTGIGLWSDAEFLRAVHKGIGRGGKPLYPAFPYASYALLTDADVLAIRAYLNTIKPVMQPSRANTLKFPYNQRVLMIVWARLFSPDHRFRPIPQRSGEWNRGAYLVEAAEHCGECHSPRNLAQAMDNRRKFAGGAAEGWSAYNITGDVRTGVGSWGVDEIARFLETGHSPGRGSAGGPMAEAIDLSLSRLSNSDVRAMAVYLKTVPAVHSPNLPERLAGPAPSGPLQGAGEDLAGRRIFEGACASCHGWNGLGMIYAKADLTGSRAINDAAATNVAQMVISGTGGGPSGRPFMPSFGAAYSDTEIAAVSNYVTRRFGSEGSKLTASQVKKLRSLN